MKGPPKGTWKARVTIGHNGLRKSMEFEDVGEEERGKNRGIDDGGGGEEATHLGEAVHNGEDGIMAKCCSTEGYDEVHGDASPWLGGDGERLEEAGVR